MNPWLGDNHYIIFLGDYVDRGPFSLQVLQAIASLLIKHPEHVLLLKGNHEGPGEVYVNPQNYFYEFVDEINPRELMKIVQNFMDLLLTAAIIPDYTFLVHGYIPTSTTSLKRIAEAHLNHPNDPALIEMLWSDPSPLPINSTNPRGQGYRVGTGTLIKFLEENRLKWVIRGHESFPLGYSVSEKTLAIHSLRLPVYGNPRPVYLKLPLDAEKDPSAYLNFV